MKMLPIVFLTEFLEGCSDDPIIFIDTTQP